MSVCSSSPEPLTSSNSSGTACAIKRTNKDHEIVRHALNNVRGAVEFLRIYRDTYGDHQVPLVQLLLVQHELEDKLGTRNRGR
jgi:hypothetical protein